MAHKRLDKEKLQTGINNDEYTPAKEAVIIQDPKKRRQCPICSQNMNLYYLNFEEMFLMCENNSCDFPFGYEALQIVRDESELREQPDKASKDFFEYPTVGGSELPNSLDSILGSISGLSDCDRLSMVSTISDPDDFQLVKQDTLATKLSRQNYERRKQKEKDKELEIDLKHTKELTATINQLDQEPQDVLKLTKNNSWMKNLKVWEVVIGRKLIATNKQYIMLGNNKLESPQQELEISINKTSVSGESPVVNIQILNNGEECQKTSHNDTKEDQNDKAHDTDGKEKS